jgi:hypothetical protein
MSRSWVRLSPPAREQNDDCGAARDEIDAVAGVVIDAHFPNAAAHRFDVGRVSDFQPIDARLDTRSRSAVA